MFLDLAPPDSLFWGGKYEIQTEYGLESVHHKIQKVHHMYKMVHDTTSPTNSSFGQLITWSFGSADNLLYYHFVV